MVKIRAIAIVTLALILLPYSPVRAQEPNPKATPYQIDPIGFAPPQTIPGLAGMISEGLPPDEILAEVNKSIDLLWPVAVAKQKEYFEMTKGRYFQGLFSHREIPTDGKNLLPDGWFTRPTDQQYRWSDIGIFAYEPMPYDLAMDTYNGPEGPGFVARFRIVFKEVTYEKDMNYGPESLRNLDWFVVQEEK